MAPKKLKKDGSRFFYSTPKKKKESSAAPAEKDHASSQNALVLAVPDGSAIAAPLTQSAEATAGPSVAAVARTHKRSRRRNGGGGMSRPAQESRDDNDLPVTGFPLAVLSPQQARAGAVPRSTNVRRVEGVEALPLARLPHGTNLNIAPANYLLPDFRYGVHRHAQGFRRNADVALGALLASGVRNELSDFGGGNGGARTNVNGGSSSSSSGGGGGASSGHGGSSPAAPGGAAGALGGGIPRVITGGDVLKELFRTSLDATDRDELRKAYIAAREHATRASGADTTTGDDDDGDDYADEVVTPLLDSSGNVPGFDDMLEPAAPLTLHVHRIGPTVVINSAPPHQTPSTVAEARQRAITAKALYATELQAGLMIADDAGVTALSSAPSRPEVINTAPPSGSSSPVKGGGMAAPAGRAREPHFIVPVLATAQPVVESLAEGGGGAIAGTLANPYDRRARNVAVGDAYFGTDGSVTSATLASQLQVAGTGRIGSAQVQRNIDPALHAYSHVLQWGIDDLNILLGVDTPVVRDPLSGDNMMLTVHDDAADPRGLSGRAALDAWFDATLANVPQIAVLIHTLGVVRQYDVKPVTSVLDVVDGRKAAAALSYTSHVLQWVLANCTRDGGNYVVIRNPITLELELYDVSDDQRIRRHEALPLDTPLLGATTEHSTSALLSVSATDADHGSISSTGSVGGAAARSITPPLEDRGKAQLHHGVAMLCFKMGMHLASQLRDGINPTGDGCSAATLANDGQSRRDGRRAATGTRHGTNAPTTPVAPSGVTFEASASSATSAAATGGASPFVSDANCDNSGIGGGAATGPSNKAADALALLQRSLALLVQEYRHYAARDDAREEACATLLRAPLHIAEELPDLIASFIASRMTELYNLHQRTVGFAKPSAGSTKLCGTVEEHDVTTTIQVPALYGDAMNIICDVAHVVMPLVSDVLGRAPMASTAKNAALLRQSASAGARMLLHICKAMTAVLSRVVDRHRKVWIDRDIRRKIEADKVQPSAAFTRTNKDSFDRIQKDIMTALIDVGMTGVQLYQMIVDTLVSLLDKEKMIVHGPERARSGPSPGNSPTAASTSTSSSGGSGTAHEMVIKDEIRLVARSDVALAHASLAEYTGDVVMMSIVDRTHTTVRRVIERARGALALAGPVPPRPKVVAGFADCAAIPTLAQLDEDPVASSHQALRFFRMTKSTCRRILEKNAEVYLKVGYHYSLTDRYTKALESLRIAKDLISSSQYAPEGDRFGTYSQENISGVCLIALEVTVADVHVRKAKAAHSSTLMVHDHNRKKAGSEANPAVSASERADAQRSLALHQPLIEASWSPDRLVPLSQEEESNWRTAIDIYRRVCDMTAGGIPDCDDDPHAKGDVGFHFAAKFRGLLAESLLHLGTRTVDTLAYGVLANESRGVAELIDPERLRDVREFFSGVYQLLPACSAKSLKLAYEELRLFAVALRSAVPLAQRNELHGKDLERVTAWRKLGHKVQDRLCGMLAAVNEGLNEGALPCPSGPCDKGYCPPSCATTSATGACAAPQRPTPCTAATATTAATNQSGQCPRDWEPTVCVVEDEDGTSSVGSAADTASSSEPVDAEALRKAMRAAEDACGAGADDAADLLDTVEDALKDYEGDKLSSYGGGAEPFLLPGVKMKVGTYYAERTLHAAFATPLVQVHHQLAVYWFIIARLQAATERPDGSAAAATGGCNGVVASAITSGPAGAGCLSPGVRNAVVRCLSHARHGLRTVLVGPHRESPAYRHHAAAQEQLVRNALLLGLRFMPKGVPCTWAEQLTELLHVTTDFEAFTAARIDAVARVAEESLGQKVLDTNARMISCSGGCSS